MIEVVRGESSPEIDFRTNKMEPHKTTFSYFIFLINMQQKWKGELSVVLKSISCDFNHCFFWNSFPFNHDSSFFQKRNWCVQLAHLLEIPKWMECLFKFLQAFHFIQSSRRIVVHFLVRVKFPTYVCKADLLSPSLDPKGHEQEMGQLPSLGNRQVKLGMLMMTAIIKLHSKQP